MFISIEGGEGVGKTSLAAALTEKLEAVGRRVVSVREPGGTAFGEALRQAFLTPDTNPVPLSEAFVLAAARCDLVHHVIRPALLGGGIVICDRYIDATYAYQGYGRNLNRATLRQLNQMATGGLEPDLTLLLDMPPELALERDTAKNKDRIERENLAFHQRVRSGYLDLAASDPRFRTIDATQPADKVVLAAMRHLDAAAPFYLAEKRQ